MCRDKYRSPQLMIPAHIKVSPCSVYLPVRTQDIMLKAIFQLLLIP